ncbi:MAG: GNAT family N-acetyltransferase [Anaerolineae bacterium]
MKITVQPASRADKSLLRRLMELYLYDFSAFTGEDVDEKGLYGYEYFDHYWVESTRYPFLIYVDGHPAGFALVRVLRLNDDQVVHSMAEFFVMRKYRGRGVGREAAYWLFDRFPGRWRVGERPENRGAQIFWRKVIGAYTGGRFEEIVVPNWDGPMQAFETPPGG